MVLPAWLFAKTPAKILNVKPRLAGRFHNPHPLIQEPLINVLELAHSDSIQFQEGKQKCLQVISQWKWITDVISTRKRADGRHSRLLTGIQL